MSNIIIRPQYYKNKQGATLEGIGNESVKAAMEYMKAEEQKYFPAIEDCKKDIIKLLTYITDATFQKNYSIFPTVLLKYSQQTSEQWKKDIINKVICFMCGIKENSELILSVDMRPEDTLFTEIKDFLGFAFHPSCFGYGKKIKASQCFKSRLAIYNETANFEHSCFILALILMEEIDIEKDKEIIETFLYAFHFLMRKYYEHSDKLIFVVYHMFKLLRLWLINSLAPHNDNVFKSFSGVKFNLNYNDPNIEFYGDVRITQNNSYLDHFMVAPRSECYSDDKNVLWFNYNSVSGMTGLMTYRSNEILDCITNGTFKRFKTLGHLAWYMTKQDIKIRSELSLKGLLVRYIHISVGDECENVQQELKNYILDFFTEHQLYPVSEEQYNLFKDYKIGLTYRSEEDEVVSSIVDNLTFSDIVGKKETSYPHPNINVDKFIAVFDEIEITVNDRTIKKYTRVNYAPSDEQYKDLDEKVEESFKWTVEPVDVKSFIDYSKKPNKAEMSVPFIRKVKPHYAPRRNEDVRRNGEQEDKNKSFPKHRPQFTKQRRAPRVMVKPIEAEPQEPCGFLPEL